MIPKIADFSDKIMRHRQKSKAKSRFDSKRFRFSRAMPPCPSAQAERLAPVDPAFALPHVPGRAPVAEW
jgi:hypothetical protein